MPLPTSGPLSLSAIRGQFGGSAPDGLSEYYAGGSRVPAGTTGINGAIPSSGIIAVSKFYGAPQASADINLVFNSRRGPDTDIYGPGNGGSGGWGTAYRSTGYPFGNIASGSDTSTEGWSVWGCAMLQQFGGGPYGIVMHMTAAPWTNARFLIDINHDYDLDTNLADTDQLVDLDWSQGQITLRELFWDLGTSATEVWLDWTTGTKSLHIERVP